MSHTIIPTEDSDIEELLRSVREVNLEEAVAKGFNPAAIMSSTLARSRAHWTGRVGSELVAVWGVEAETLLSRDGFLWLCTTHAIIKHQFVFIKYSKKFIQKISEEFDLLWGVVDDDFDDSKRWLRWLGFTIFPPVKVNKKFICRFEKRIR